MFLLMAFASEAFSGAFPAVLAATAVAERSAFLTAATAFLSALLVLASLWSFFEELAVILVMCLFDFSFSAPTARPMAALADLLDLCDMVSFLIV